MSFLDRFEPFYRVLDGLRNILTFGLFAFIITAGAVQIFLRYTPGLSGFAWTDEILRYLNIWVVFLGAGIAVRRGDHIRLDYFVQMLSGRRLKRIVTAIQNLLIVGALLVLIVEGSLKVVRSIPVVIQAAPITIAVFYLAVPFGCALMLIDYLLIMRYGSHPYLPKPQPSGEVTE